MDFVLGPFTRFGHRKFSLEKFKNLVLQCFEKLEKNRFQSLKFTVSFQMVV